jgi:hypothetical protein
MSLPQLSSTVNHALKSLQFTAALKFLYFTTEISILIKLTIKYKPPALASLKIVLGKLRGYLTVLVPTLQYIYSRSFGNISQTGNARGF